jgi:hypothetical protein
MGLIFRHALHDQLSGWSLGGYLAPRAASGEHRLAARIADPGQWSIAEGFRAAAIRLGASPDGVLDMGRIDDALPGVSEGADPVCGSGRRRGPLRDDESFAVSA